MSGHHRTKEYAAFARRMRPLLTATLPAPCVDGCGQPVMVGQRWDIGHIIPGIDEQWNVGPSHVKCNRSAGGSMGAAIVNAKRKRKTQVPQW